MTPALQARIEAQLALCEHHLANGHVWVAHGVVELMALLTALSLLAEFAEIMGAGNVHDKWCDWLDPGDSKCNCRLATANDALARVEALLADGGNGK